MAISSVEIDSVVSINNNAARFFPSSASTNLRASDTVQSALLDVKFRLLMDSDKTDVASVGRMLSNLISSGLLGSLLVSEVSKCCLSQKVMTGG